MRGNNSKRPNLCRQEVSPRPFSKPGGRPTGGWRLAREARRPVWRQQATRNLIENTAMRIPHGRASIRSSHLQVIPLEALGKWEISGLDAKPAFQRTGVLGREIYNGTPARWDPSYAQRIWALRALPYGVYDAPAAFHRSLRENSSNSEKSLEKSDCVFGPLASTRVCTSFSGTRAGHLAPSPLILVTFLGVAGRISQGRFKSSRDIAPGRRRCRRRPLCAWTWNFRSGAISRPSRPRKSLRRS